ncbi:hypothetical protein J6590_010533 [Homalodisca vitripennis]|nr:hypothetical protein J6590_010533 [Homalodisca vitripennis]
MVISQIVLFIILIIFYRMELAITELEESFKNSINRVNDTEWKIEQLQQFKNSNCDSVVKLFGKVAGLEESNKKLTEEYSIVNCDFEENRINFRNSFRNLEAQISTLKRNVENLKSNSNTE